MRATAGGKRRTRSRVLPKAPSLPRVSVFIDEDGSHYWRMHPETARWIVETLRWACAAPGWPLPPEEKQ